MSLLDELRQEAALKSQIARNRFLVLLGGVTLVSVVLVAIAMSVYNSSGAAQLDASGPRFIGVRDQVIQDRLTTAFPASGAFDKQSFDDFLKAYDGHTKAIGQVNGYDPAAVNNDSFNLAPATPAPSQ